MSERPEEAGREDSPKPAATPAPLRLVVGLGNPGASYTNTRHNVGFMVVEKIATDIIEPFEHSKRWNADIARFGQGNYLAKPQTYMNLSGEAVAQIAHFYRIEPKEILVVFDDIALPLGRLRIRPKGSAGGHNGMKSLIQELGTEDFPRLRLGIGNNDLPGEMINHVLGKFSKSEQSELEKSVERAVLAVCHIRDHGLQDAMTLFNAAAEKKKPDPNQEESQQSS
ncbi:MAG: PTH1 family peptidyl-tRNA hydrolase [Verrucomicrobiales bacterium]|jgi:PTH1 family peptidyl-tRNA hydrolase